MKNAIFKLNQNKNCARKLEKKKKYVRNQMIA